MSHVYFKFGNSKKNVETVVIEQRTEVTLIDLPVADPLKKGCSREVIAQNIRMCMGEGKSQKQCVAIALTYARKQGCKISTKKKRKDLMTTEMINDGAGITGIWISSNELQK